MATGQEILAEVQQILAARENNYDDPRENFERIAAGWKVIFGVDVSPEQVAMAMIWTKIAREVHKHTQDNGMDMIGYAVCLMKIADQQAMQLTEQKI